MPSAHRRPPMRAVVPGVVLVTFAAVVVLGAPAARAAVPDQAAPGNEIAKFIRTEWWPQARTSLAGPDIGYETLPIKKVRCPKTVPATSGDSESVLNAALGDLAAGEITPSVDPDTGVFTCVARLDRQPILIGGAINEAGGAHFATASLLLSPDALAESVAAEFADQIGGTAAVVCSTRSVIVAQPDVALRCKVVADDGTRGTAEVVLDDNATIRSVDFAQR